MASVYEVFKGRPIRIGTCRSRTNADDRLPRAALGRVEGGDGIVEGRDVAEFVRSRPSRTRWTISLSWARSDSTTKSTARPSAGRASVGPTMDTWGTSKEENFADENFQRLLRDSCGQGELGAEFTDRLMTPHVGGGLT